MFNIYQSVVDSAGNAGYQLVQVFTGTAAAAIAEASSLGIVSGRIDMLDPAQGTQTTIWSA